jgi:hypothetical protein
VTLGEVSTNPPLRAWDHYQGVDARGRLRDRVRCDSCRRWANAWLRQGLLDGVDDDATSRNLCIGCAVLRVADRDPDA